jgi:hypothetical protein
MIAIALVAASGAFALATNGSAEATTPPKPLPRVTVYVESQDLCYESIVTAQNLPPNGQFQTLEPDDTCGPGTFTTEFGPGDPGYLGGRWMMETPAGTVYFMCPLLPPGTSP